MTPRVAILTISDSAIAGTRADASGPALREKCVSLGWHVTAELLVADEAHSISQAISKWADDHIADVILTTGGTGVAPRDVTPEATRKVLDREIPGLAEQLRARGLQQTRYAVLSRGVVGSRKETLIVNLPGAPVGAVFSLGVIQDLVPHVVKLLLGDTAH